MKYRYIFITTAIFFLSFSVSFASFQRNLTTGSTGQDVLELQKLLNQDIRTRLAESGPGSPGSETTYFGNITRSAVIKFQEIYKNEVLAPINLSLGTGFVGVLTRGKLNNLAVIDTTEAVNPPEIISVSPKILTPGSLVTIKGENFLSSRNIIGFAGEKIANISSSDNQTIFFVTPRDIAPGLQQLFVINSNGISEDIFVEVVNETVNNAPSISSISPNKGTFNTKVKITGENFNSDNTVHVSYTKLNLPSTDGKTIEFLINPEQFKIPGLDDLEIWMYIENSNGTSNPVVFTLTQ